MIPRVREACARAELIPDFLELPGHVSIHACIGGSPDKSIRNRKSDKRPGWDKTGHRVFIGEVPLRVQAVEPVSYATSRIFPANAKVERKVRPVFPVVLEVQRSVVRREVVSAGGVRSHGARRRPCPGFHRGQAVAAVVVRNRKL